MGKEKPDVIYVEGAPEWMVSFSDLNTLLLTFFILLLVFAEQKKVGCSDVGKAAADSVEKRGPGGPYHGALSTIIYRHIRKDFGGRVPIDPSGPREQANDIYLGKGAWEDLPGSDKTVGTAEIIPGFFSPGKSDLTTSGKASLRDWFGQVVGRGDAYSRLRITCRAKTDHLLAVKRSSRVREYLVDELNATEGRIELNGEVQSRRTDYICVELVK